MGSTRTKALNPDAKVRQSVKDRDSYDGQPCCVMCGSPNANDMAHYVAKSQGGLAIEENLVLLCRGCHAQADHGMPEPRKIMRRMMREYL
ncbi:MAG: HNH endonuclease, partial [Oscillospiraceae bacterium]|nr:HNH endonuclease [Oscillospiraceae bacterium]